MQKRLSPIKQPLIMLVTLKSEGRQ